MDARTRWRIAIHEAAVCARLLRLPCAGGASVWPDPHAVFPDDCGWASISALMAGAISEAVVLGDYDPSVIRHDWARLMQLGLGDGEIDALWLGRSSSCFRINA